MEARAAWRGAVSDPPPGIGAVGMRAVPAAWSNQGRHHRVCCREGAFLPPGSAERPHGRVRMAPHRQVAQLLPGFGPGADLSMERGMPGEPALGLFGDWEKGPGHRAGRLWLGMRPAGLWGDGAARMDGFRVGTAGLEGG